MKMRGYGRWPLAVAAVAGLGIAACSDDPAGLDDHADEVEGVELVLNAAVVASYDGDARAWTGQLEIDAGQETAHITVRFVDHDGDPVALDDDEYVEVEIANETVAEWEQDTPGEAGGHLVGLVAGETTAVFRLMHGAVGAGHADFETTSVVVRVN